MNFFRENKVNPGRYSSIFRHGMFPAKELKNWKEKRFRVDLNYLLLTCGFDGLKKVSKKIRPRKKLVDEVKQIARTKEMIDRSNAVMEKRVKLGLNKQALPSFMGEVDKLVVKLNDEIVEEEIATTQKLREAEKKLASGKENENSRSRLLGMNRKRYEHINKLRVDKRELLNRVDKKYIESKAYKELYPKISAHINNEVAETKTVSILDFRKALLNVTFGAKERQSINLVKRVENILEREAKLKMSEDPVRIAREKTFKEIIEKRAKHTESLKESIRKNSEKWPTDEFAVTRISEKIQRLQEKVFESENYYNALIGVSEEFFGSNEEKIYKFEVEADKEVAVDYMNYLKWSLKSSKKLKSSEKRDAKKWDVKREQNSQLLVIREKTPKYKKLTEDVNRRKLLKLMTISNTKAGKLKMKKIEKSKIKKVKLLSKNRLTSNFYERLGPEERSFLSETKKGSMVIAGRYKRDNLFRRCLESIGRSETTFDEFLGRGVFSNLLCTNEPEVKVLITVEEGLRLAKLRANLQQIDT